MKIFHRRILYIIFILLFFIITPAISFYATGYNFDFNSGQIQRTGILIIKTNPKDTLVNLGKEKTSNWFYNFFSPDEELRTPQKIRNLLPDEYEMILTKDGYFDYQRKIKINPGETLVLNELELFRKAYPEILVNKNLTKIKLSPDKNKLAAVAGEKLIILDLADEDIKEIFLDNNFSTQNFDILWAPSNKKILLTYGDYPVFNIENNSKEIELRNYFFRNIKKIIWDDFSDSEIYVQENSGVYHFDLIGRKKNLFLSKSVDNFTIKDNNFFAIEEIKNENFLNIYNNAKQVKSISIPTSIDYNFIEEDDKFIYLNDQRHDILYIIDPWSIFPIQDSINSIKDFSVVNNKILYWNDFEIWLYDKDNRNKTLITRVSEEINKAILYPEENHIIYNTEKSVNIIELNDNRYLSLIKILDWQETSNLFLKTDGQTIYFSGWLGEKRVLYSLDIK